MPGEITAVASAVTSITTLVDGLLSRADRDAPDKEFNENLTKIQNAFAHNEVDSDDFRRWIDGLFIRAGHTFTPTGNVPMGRREFTHASLVLAASLIHERQLAARAIQKK